MADVGSWRNNMKMLASRRKELLTARSMLVRVMNCMEDGSGIVSNLSSGFSQPCVSWKTFAFLRSSIHLFFIAFCFLSL